MNVGEICNREVVFAYKSMVLSEAARLMRDEHVGSLVVVEETDSGRVPVGMITDRDIVVAVIARDVDARTISVADAMSGDLAVVRESDSEVEVMALMRRRGIRRVPVVTPAGTLAGLVTLDDLLELFAEQLAVFARAVHTERDREARVRT